MHDIQKHINAPCMHTIHCVLSILLNKENKRDIGPVNALKPSHSYIHTPILKHTQSRTLKKSIHPLHYRKLTALSRLAD